MNIHEYQGKAIYRKYGLPVSAGIPAFTPAEAIAAADQLPGPLWVVKSQIHAGGRGKGRFKEASAGEKGGVRLAFSKDDVATFATQMLGATLVTEQTGPAGRVVNRLYIEDGSDIDRELYLSALVDRTHGGVSFVASPDGGMDIEKVAHDTPERVHTIAVDFKTGATDAHGKQIAQVLGLTGHLEAECVEIVEKLYEMFTKEDMSLLEINPLIVTKDQHLKLLDAKISFDSNASYRHPEWAQMRDLGEEDEKEIEASKYDLAYIALDGTIGCMVNGAGLAMATMDIIKLYGAEPANFLDVGGGATKERVTTAFKIILGDKNVEGILVNIFGGIMRCDVIAEGVVAAAREVSLHVPLVVRLEGTNVELGKKILSESGLPITSADNLADAAEKVVAAVKGAR
jgi:succinyl-CoA synthetase beta subunit